MHRECFNLNPRVQIALNLISATVRNYTINVSFSGQCIHGVENMKLVDGLYDTQHAFGRGFWPSFNSRSSCPVSLLKPRRLMCSSKHPLTSSNTFSATILLFGCQSKPARCHGFSSAQFPHCFWTREPYGTTVYACTYLNACILSHFCLKPASLLTSPLFSPLS